MVSGIRVELRVQDSAIAHLISLTSVTINTVTGSATSIVEANYLNLLLVIVAGLICQYVNN